MTDPQKTAVIFGLANKRSIAWAIAQKLQQAGWRLAITYQNERLALEAKDLISHLPGADGFMCDVTQDDQLARLFGGLKEKYGVLHGLVHSIGYAPEPDLKGDFVNTTREGFRIANDISVYSLIAVSRGVLPLMTSGGSIVTMTYYGAEKVVPRYNVMGVAKAALEASMAPVQVADLVFDAVRNGRFYILTDPDWTEVIQLRTDKLLRMENPQNPTATIVTAL